MQQARGAAGDVVLLGVALAAFLLSLSLAMSIPAELAEAPSAAREELVAPFDAVLATYPLHRVRCIHVAGGSWWPLAGGDRFRREVLARGASRPAAENFQAFRGRAPKPDALLRHHGLAA